MITANQSALIAAKIHGVVALGLEPTLLILRNAIVMTANISHTTHTSHHHLLQFLHVPAAVEWAVTLVSASSADQGRGLDKNEGKYFQHLYLIFAT